MTPEEELMHLQEENRMLREQVSQLQEKSRLQEEQQWQNYHSLYLSPNICS